MKREICEKCVHYIQHYIINKYGAVLKIPCGHCAESQMYKKECLKFNESTTSNNDDNVNKVYDFQIQTRCLLRDVKELSEKIGKFTNTLLGL